MLLPTVGFPTIPPPSLPGLGPKRKEPGLEYPREGLNEEGNSRKNCVRRGSQGRSDVERKPPAARRVARESDD